MGQEQSSHLSDDGRTREPLANNSRQIFRVQAIEHYIQNQERIELPRLISTRLFRYLWVSALLLMALGAIIAFWPLIRLQI